MAINRSELVRIREELRRCGPDVSPADLRITLLELLDAMGYHDGRGRPRATAPAGRVTLARAAELSGMSKAAVQLRVQNGIVPAITAEDGSMSIASKDVKRLVRGRRSFRRGP